MDKNELYTILDIEQGSEFIYMESMDALLEEDEEISIDLLEELLADVDFDTFKELLDTYFDTFLKKLPDDMTDLYITVDNIKRLLLGCADAVELAAAIFKFRKWYVTNSLVTDMMWKTPLSVRDARYHLIASEFTGESFYFDFSDAIDFEFEGYNVFLTNLIDDEEDLEM